MSNWKKQAKVEEQAVEETLVVEESGTGEGQSDPPTAPGLVPMGQVMAVDLSQLVQLVTAAVTAAMGQAQGINHEALGQTIGEAVALGISKTTRRRLTIGEYEPRSPFHPGPKATKPRLKRSVFQNGGMCSADTLHDNEINYLNRLTHSGRYLDRKVEVRVDDSSAEETVYISFDNRRDSMQEIKSVARNFEDMLRQIVEIQEQEDRDSDERQERRTARR